MNRKTSARRISPTRIYQLHVELDDIEPRIWRRLWVADTLTLAKLDRVIQAAMGWTNSHLHEFEIEGTRYGMLDDEWPQDRPLLDDKRHRLGQVLGEKVVDFVYTYDFGDNWEHAVTVEKRLEPEEQTNTWPICLAGENACPRRMSAASAATWNSSKPSATRRIQSTSRCGAGSAAPSIPAASTSTPPTQRSGNCADQPVKMT